MQTTTEDWHSLLNCRSAERFGEHRATEAHLFNVLIMSKGPIVINYSEIIEDIMPLVVKKVLGYIHNDQLPIGHYFYISFSTTHPGVIIPKRLLAKYPKEMTIVLQYQFENLLVEEDKFSVTLSFNELKERLKVPYAALTGFIDPEAKFGLQLNSSKLQKQGQNVVDINDHSKIQTPTKHEPQNPVASQPNNVISFDALKKGKKK